MPTNDDTNWFRRLAGEEVPITDGEPDYGFYRLKHRRTGALLPVAYWYEGGALICLVDQKRVDEQRALEAWIFASKTAVSYEDYRERLTTGKWPGESAAVIGHNQSPVDDTPEAIAERIDDLAREAERLMAAGAATDDPTSDQASDLANTFGEIEGKVAELHKIEKQPHLNAGRAVDTKWFKLKDRATDLKRRLKATVVTPWLIKKHEDAQQAARAAIAVGTAPEALPQPRLTAGSSKRSTGLRTQTTAQVDNWSDLIDHLKAHPDIRNEAQRIANASAKVGIVLPGCTIKKERAAA